MSPSAATLMDGRQSRTARSRLAICEACVDLVAEGVLQPSADDVASRAGVSRRSIFNHFVDLAELYDAVVEVGIERCASLIEEISDREPIADRIDHVVRVRAKYLEGTSAFTRALTAQALVGPASDEALRISKEGLRLQLQDTARVFGPELAGLSSTDRAEVVEAVSAATAPLLWETLRFGRGHSVSRARAVMKRMLVSILRDADVAV